MQVFSVPHFPFDNTLEVEFFAGKPFGFRAQTIASVFKAFECFKKRKGKTAKSKYYRT